MACAPFLHGAVLQGVFMGSVMVFVSSSQPPSQLKRIFSWGLMSLLYTGIITSPYSIRAGATNYILLADKSSTAGNIS